MDYPSIPRIALTGEAMGAVRGLIDQYELADLLFKNEMTLAEARQVLRRVLTSELSLELRSRRGDLWDEFSEWRDAILRRIDGRAPAAGNDAAGAPAALEASRAAFESDGRHLAGLLAAVRSEADLTAAGAEFAALRERYRDAF